MQGNLLAWLLQ